MTKELTEQEKKQIKDTVIASCVSKGIKPTLVSGGRVVPNPLYASCIQLGYDDAIRHASQGKLGLWFSKVNSFVQSQGGFTGLLQSVSSLANKYKVGTPDVPGTGTLPPYGQDYYPGSYPGDYPDKRTGSTALWLVLIVLLLVLIVATAIYFSKKSKPA
jgi:hypothetical protein